jgi:hypothetical protein
LIRLERLDRDEHSSLFGLFTSVEENMLNGINTWSESLNVDIFRFSDKHLAFWHFLIFFQKEINLNYFLIIALIVYWQARRRERDRKKL